MALVAGLSSNRVRAVKLRLGRLLLALCCLLLCCGSLCQARVSPGMEEGRVVYFEVGVAAVRRVSPAGDGGDASTTPLPPPSGSGVRTERLLRSVPSPGIGH
ncbi:hypothetical protein ABZP36_016330 [Zizania latifolia]